MILIIKDLSIKMINRIINKLDEYLSKNDYAAAEKHLLYWLSDANKNSNYSICLTVSNELMGLYRKLGEKEKALSFSDSALQLIQKMGICDNIGAATTYINCATVYKAFGMPQESIPLFERAQSIYEKNLDKCDQRLGGLYNNMGLALVDLGRFEEADNFYCKAISVMANTPNGKPEQAITLLNMASAAEVQLGLENAQEKISECIEKAMLLLDDAKSDTDGNYAFVCEKCASVFGYYGYFYYENELKNRARKIYERA